MFHTMVIARETFRLLRRDRVFLPAVIGSLVITILANLASDWSIEEFEKILFDIGGFGYQLTGSIVAIFWGTKTIQDSRLEGSLEVQLATPISRESWILGKFVGLSMALLLLGVVMLLFWQVTMVLNYFGLMNRAHLWTFALLTINWYLLAAVAIFFSSFCTQAVALFSSFCLWLTGLSTALVHDTLSVDASPMTRKAVEILATVWDFQRFNQLEFLTEKAFLPTSELVSHGVYGLMLVGLLMVAACIVFRGRDLI